MAHSTSSLQTIIDISKKVDEALKGIELPKGYKLENAQVELTWNKNYVARIYTYPQNDISEPQINTNVVG